MIVENFLRTLGLTENETRVYLYLLSHGESIASIIAKRLELKRTAIYAILENLEQKGMLTSFLKNDVTHFDAIDPDEIVEMCKQKVDEMNRIAKKAAFLKNEFQKIREKGKMPTLEIRGKIKYYQGLEAVTDLIDETLDEKEKEQLCFGLNAYHTEMSGDDWKSYTQKRVQKGIFVRSIQPATPIAIEYKGRDQKELRKTRLVPYDKFPGECEINIIGDTIAMFTIKGKEPVGMKMKNKFMASTLKSLFELAWKQSALYNAQEIKKRK